LLVWPDLLGTVGRDLIRELITTGVRVLALGQDLDRVTARGLGAVPLKLWQRTHPAAGRAESPLVEDANGAAPTPRRWQEMVQLWQTTGLTPLPDSARAASAWRHAWQLKDGRVCSCASMQQLAAPLGPDRAEALVCAVATNPASGGRGHASATVAAVARGTPVAVALTEPGDGSDGFFARTGWRRVGSAFLYRYP
jgi:hypothetical protein